MKRVVQPTATVRIRTGDADQNSLTAYDYGVVEEWTGAQWRKQPDFARIGNGTHTEFTVELLSNVVEKNFQSHLMLYAGKMQFCCRAHRGDDGLGVAMRRTQDGRRVPVECNPDECAWRRLHLAHGGESSHIMAELVKQYKNEFPYVKFLSENKKRETVSAMCLPANFLICALVHPTDSTRFIHGPSEFALFHSKSDKTHGNIIGKLRTLWSSCHGQLKGYRVKLVYRPFTNRFGKNSPAWDIEDASDSDIAKQQIEAAQRRQLRALNYDDIIANVDTKALATLDHQHSLAVMAHETGIELANMVRAQIDDSRDLDSVAAEYVDPASVTLVNQIPIVARMCERINLSYPARVKLAMRFGGDVYRAMSYLRDLGETNKVYTGDIWAEYTHSLPGYNQPALSSSNPARPPSAMPAIIEAEFTEVPACEESDSRSDAALMAAVRGEEMSEEEKARIIEQERAEAQATEKQARYEAEKQALGLGPEIKQGRLL